MPLVLKIEKLSVGYNGKSLLKNIGFSLKEGDIIALMGKNGCGKTTLIKTLSGLLPPASGKIFVGTDDLRKLSLKEKAKKISVVLTERIDLSRLSVLEILLMARYPFETSDKINNEIVHSSSDLVGINGLLKKEYSLLSDGQKQIVLLCRALVQDTKVIILDEPFTFLDIPRKLEVMKILTKISRERKISIIFSTHDWELIHTLNSKVLLIKDQENFTLENAKVLLEKGEIEEVFGHTDFLLDKKLGRFTLKDN